MLTHLMLWRHLTVCLVHQNIICCTNVCLATSFLIFLLDAYTYSLCLQEKLDMELQVRFWPASCHQCSFAEITLTKSHFCKICLRLKHFLSLNYTRTHVYIDVLKCLHALSHNILFQYYQNSIEMIRSDFLAGHWKPYLLRALTLQPCYNGPINGGEVIFSTYTQYPIDVIMSELT